MWQKQDRRMKNRDGDSLPFVFIFNEFLLFDFTEYDTRSSVKRVTSLRTTKRTRFWMETGWHDQIWCGLDSVPDAGFVSKFTYNLYGPPNTFIWKSIIFRGFCEIILSEPANFLNRFLNVVRFHSFSGSGTFEDRSLCFFVTRVIGSFYF